MYVYIRIVHERVSQSSQKEPIAATRAAPVHQNSSVLFQGPVYVSMLIYAGRHDETTGLTTEVCKQVQFHIHTYFKACFSLFFSSDFSWCSCCLSRCISSFNWHKDSRASSS